MKKIDVNPETYELKGFYVDVIDFINPKFGEGYEAWIYDPAYGTKILMFGCPKEQQSYDEFLELVEANIDTYIRIYKDHDWYEED